MSERISQGYPDEVEFKSFPSISRLSRQVIITEKLDGTNAQIYVSDSGKVRAASRNRWITPEDDNHGFAKWVKDHEDELRTGLGPGYHFGEWWGQGIARKYGLKEKRFSLFNVSRWDDSLRDVVKHPTPRPSCCHVVPVLNILATFDSFMIDETLSCLSEDGSYAAPGFMNPEGIVVFHPASGTLFKKTLDGDGHKGQKNKQN